MKEAFASPWTPEIHRAEWVVPVSTSARARWRCVDPCRPGCRRGPFTAMRRNSPAGARLTDHGQAALFPALVNAHTHLELSSLRGKIPFPQPRFCEWIQLLLALRAGMESNSVDDGLRSGEAELLGSGTGFCADITNGGAGEYESTAGRNVQYSCSGGAEGILAAGAKLRGPAGQRHGDIRDTDHPGWRSGFPSLERRIFLELLGFNLDSIAAAMPASRVGGRTDEILAAGDAIPVPHSAYSVSPAIIQSPKNGRGRAGFLSRSTWPNTWMRSNFSERKRFLPRTA